MNGTAPAMHSNPVFQVGLHFLPVAATAPCQRVNPFCFIAQMTFANHPTIACFVKVLTFLLTTVRGTLKPYGTNRWLVGRVVGWIFQVPCFSNHSSYNNVMQKASRFKDFCSPCAFGYTYCSSNSGPGLSSVFCKHIPLVVTIYVDLQQLNSAG